MDSGLTDKTVVVTGAARGIGAAIAEHFLTEGCDVYLTDIDVDGACARAALLGGRAVALQMDVRDRPQVRRVLAEIDNRADGIDILINNAGLMTTGTLAETTDGVWDDLLATNVTGIFNCVQAVVPRMAERRSGAIVNIASVSAAKGGGTFGNIWYGATKAAVVAMTKGLARELGPVGIRVNAIAPSVVETEMVKALLTPDMHRQILSKFPLGRLASTSDVARMAVFLASDLASFTTGETVAVDGGLLKV